jgi:FtsP/CotA-like multicopper oxidase with cupredoxin domain
MNRRKFLAYSGCVALCGYAGNALSKAEQIPDVVSASVTTKPGSVHIVGPDFPATDVWGFNGVVPGSPIRCVQGQTLEITVNNALNVPTAVHWHGIRLPNAMDGVAGLTQSAIKPGETFHYRFAPPDAGTYWYHSHVNAYEQVGRGLYGPLIIEEASPPAVDRDLVWMIDDWRLNDDAQIIDNFGSGHDRSHAGRIGNVPTVNGRFRDIVKVRTGERLRIRVINASNARNFSLSFGELVPTVIAVDGQPLKPYQPRDEIIVGAAGRVDLIVDMTGDPGSLMPVVDGFYRQSFDLVTFAYDSSPLRCSPLRTSALQGDISLAPSTVPEPDLAKADSYDVVIAGGAMGGLSRAQMNGEWMSLRDIARQGYVWAINGVVGNKLDLPPLIDTAAGTSIRLNIKNDTAFPHPMHLHGHHMKLLAIDGKPVDDPHWVDSPLVMPGTSVDLAFVADNPGSWLFHCHALEHHSAGLGALVKIT